MRIALCRPVAWVSRTLVMRATAVRSRSRSPRGLEPGVGVVGLRIRSTTGDPTRSPTVYDSASVLPGSQDPKETAPGAHD